MFDERYGTTPPRAAGEIEQRVIGGDWGANGYTTMAHADALARALRLSASDRLLDVGTGRAWPGLHLAARTSVVVSAASGLPFRARSFDAVIHTDVLCRLRAKLSVLRACRRLPPCAATTIACSAPPDTWM